MSQFGGTEIGSSLAITLIMIYAKSCTSILSGLGVFLLTILLTAALPLSAFAQSLESLKGQPLKAYPKLVLVSQSPLLNIYWSNNVRCADEPSNCDRIVDQSIAIQIQKRIENSVRLKIEDFDRYADKLLPQWHSKFRAKLFPLSIQIQLGEEMFYAGSIFEETGKQVVSLVGSPIGSIKLKSRISIGSQNPSFASVDTLVMHEFGHMLLRALEFPRMESTKSGRVDSLLEEALPDFISSVSNDETPVIAPGLQDRVAAMIREKLSYPKTELFQQVKMEMDLRGISHLGLRDFSKQYQYTDLYLLPGAFNSSLTFNTMFVRLRTAFGADYLRDTVIRAIVERPGLLNQADAYIVMKDLVGFFAEIYPEQFKKQMPEIRKVLKASDWVPAIRSSNEIELKSSVDAENSIDVKVLPKFDLRSLFQAKMRTVTYCVYVAGKPRFAFSNYLDYDSSRRLRFNPVGSCEASSVLCVCGNDKNLISVDGVYLSSKKTVESTKLAHLKLSSPKESACYILSFEWEEK